MYVCMYVCLFVCMYVCMYVCMHALCRQILGALNPNPEAGMYACMHVCMCEETARSTGFGLMGFRVSRPGEELRTDRPASRGAAKVSGCRVSSA